MNDRPSQKLRALWSVPEDHTIQDELNAARESALLHAQALDETRRDLERARREIFKHRLDNQKLALEVIHLRRTNRSLQETLDEALRILS